MVRVEVVLDVVNLDRAYENAESEEGCGLSTGGCVVGGTLSVHQNDGDLKHTLGCEKLIIAEFYFFV